MRSYSRLLTRVVPALVVLALVGLRLWHTPPSPASLPPDRGIPNAAVSSAAASHESGVEVEASGRVTRLLSDDIEGARHQRFLTRMTDGLTVLITHNIDLAPRVPVQPGDSVAVRGEYVWNARGGLIHWTHHDPARRHEAGWIEYRGRRYE